VFASAFLVVAHIDLARSRTAAKTDALYPVTVFATVGFGDITPTTTATRAMLTIQMVTNLVVIGLVVHLMLDAVKVRIQERRSSGNHERRSTAQSAESAPDRSPR
jgi:cytochrome c oxidase assembly factor CtaG